MTESSYPKLKALIDARLVAQLARRISAVHAAFDARGFTARCTSGLEALELTPRAWHVAEALHEHLPQPFARAADVLITSLGPKLETSETFGLSPLAYMPHVFFVQKYGLGDFEAAMRAQYELTQRFSAESSIRAYLVEHPAATYARLIEWSSDPNVHVRRLVSEGTRPRLPWAPRLRAYQRDPSPVLALLERLKDDPERYVQRSVANNLNDIGKDHPDLAVETCRRWLVGAPPARQWIVRHALRSLVKRGHPGALAALGVGGKAKVVVRDVRFAPKAVRIGGALQFSLVVESAGRRAQSLMVDYAVHFVKANGALRPKVFKLKRVTLEPGAAVELRGKVSFAPLTTRRPFPGRHQLELLVNGAAHPLGEFVVKA